jgi:hypothetical protein
VPFHVVLLHQVLYEHDVEQDQDVEQYFLTEKKNKRELKERITFCQYLDII